MDFKCDQTCEFWEVLNNVSLIIVCVFIYVRIYDVPALSETHGILYIHTTG